MKMNKHSVSEPRMAEIKVHQYWIHPSEGNRLR